MFASVAFSQKPIDNAPIIVAKSINPIPIPYNVWLLSIVTRIIIGAPTTNSGVSIKFSNAAKT